MASVSRGPGAPLHPPPVVFHSIWPLTSPSSGPWLLVLRLCLLSPSLAPRNGPLEHLGHATINRLDDVGRPCLLGRAKCTGSLMCALSTCRRKDSRKAGGAGWVQRWLGMCLGARAGGVAWVRASVAHLKSMESPFSRWWWCGH